MQNIKRALAVAMLAGGLSMGTPASAVTTVLDFAGNICGTTGDQLCANGSQIGQNYGDSAIVDVAYRSTTLNGATYEDFLKYWSSAYGDLTNVVWGGAEEVNYRSEIRFIPVAGYEVSLRSLDSGCYQNRASCQTLNYSITSLGGSAIAAGSTPTNFPGHASSAFNTAYFSDGIVFTWGPDGYDVGLDNITFDVRQIAATPPSGAVPEPATWAMMLFGFGSVGYVMRRRPQAARRIRFA